MYRSRYMQRRRRRNLPYYYSNTSCSSSCGGGSGAGGSRDSGNFPGGSRGGGRSPWKSSGSGFPRESFEDEDDYAGDVYEGPSFDKLQDISYNWGFDDDDDDLDGDLSLSDPDQRQRVLERMHKNLYKTPGATACPSSPTTRTSTPPKMTATYNMSPPMIPRHTPKISQMHRILEESGTKMQPLHVDTSYNLDENDYDIFSQYTNLTSPRSQGGGTSSSSTTSPTAHAAQYAIGYAIPKKLSKPCKPFESPVQQPQAKRTRVGWLQSISTENMEPPQSLSSNPPPLLSGRKRCVRSKSGRKTYTYFDDEDNVDDDDY